MPPRLRPGQTLLLASLVFGLFFGAGNLIFPAGLGRDAGAAVTPATLGFLVTAVGLPVLGIVASAVTGASSVREMTAPVSRRFAVAFTCLLYLTIGPLFAIPRTATVSYEIGVAPWRATAACGCSASRRRSSRSPRSRRSVRAGSWSGWGGT